MTMAVRDTSILLLGYSPLWSPAVLRRTERVRLVLQRGSAPAAPAEVVNRAERVYWVRSLVTLQELSAVAADLLCDGVPVDRVVASDEQWGYSAHYIGHLLDLPGAEPLLAMNTRDRRRVRSLAQDAGLDVAPGGSLLGTARAADLASLAQTVGFPMVVKEASGWDTSAVTARDHDELALVVEQRRETLARSSAHLLVEREVVGERFHVDAVWRDAAPWIFVVGQHVDAVRGSVFYGSVLLPEQDYATLYARVRAVHDILNRALGITRGGTHLELVLEQGTDRLLVGDFVARLGGGMIPAAIGARFGIDGRDLWAHEMLGGSLDDVSFSPATLAYTGWIDIGTAGGRETDQPQPLRGSALISAGSRPDLLALVHRLAAGLALQVT